MKVNTALVIVVIAATSLGAIAFLKNAHFQEEKRQARIGISKDEAACGFKKLAESEAEIAQFLAEKNPSEKPSYEEKKRAVERSESSCKKLSEYKEKYGSP